MKVLKETIEIEVSIDREVLIAFNVKDGRGSAVSSSEEKSIKEAARQMGEKIIDWIITDSHIKNH